jgi:uncharacterized protein YkwD
MGLPAHRNRGGVADLQHMSSHTARLVSLVALALVALTLIAPAGANVSGPRSSMQTLETGVLQEINAFRRANGLVPLRLSTKLSLAARQHSSEMAARGYFSHSSANGSKFDRRIARYYSIARWRYWSVGENLLWSSPDVDAAGALQMWLNSPEHRANLMTKRWREIGLSAVHSVSAPGSFGGREVTVITTDFGVRR